MTEVSAEEFRRFNREAVARTARRKEEEAKRAAQTFAPCPDCGLHAGKKKCEFGDGRCRRCAIVAEDARTLRGIGVADDLAYNVAGKMCDADLSFRD